MPLAISKTPDGRGPFRNYPSLRPSPFEEDGDDSLRLELLHRRWHGQDSLLRERDKQVEKNIRMLCGQHWDIWAPVLGRYVDVARYLSDDEKRWRQRPVVNLLFTWFQLTHARLTENPAIITFQPATADHMDAELAEVLDTLSKTTWKSSSMEQVLDDLVTWIIPGGRAHLCSRIDLLGGDLVPFRGPAVLRMETPGGMIEREVPDAPYGQDGQPLIGIDAQGKIVPTGQAYAMREGSIEVDVLSCLQVRGQWGPAPWEKKRWHMKISYLTPEEVWDAYGVECEPDVSAGESEGAAELNRLLFGSGFFGAAHNSPHQDGTYEDPEGFCVVKEMWERPMDFPGMEETEQSPGGRLLAATRTKVLRDGPRFAPFQSASPIRCFDFVKIPGRPQGSTPQEAMNPVLQTYNRGWAQILELRNRNTNPILWFDSSTGLESKDITNRPGQTIGVNAPSGKPPMGYITPGGVPDELFKVQQELRKVFEDMGNLPGTEGRAPTRDPSGELVKELRSNSDRFVQATARRMVVELGRMVEDWRVMWPIIMDEEKVLTWAGEDSVVRTITVYPDLFARGKVNVVPDIESMLPEGRGERQQRVRQMWQEGAFGDPLSPQAIRQYLENSRFPHLGRSVMPGGVDRLTAQVENGDLVRGKPADMIPVLEWYDHAVHMDVHYEFMKRVEYLKLDIQIQQEFVFHVEGHKQALKMLMLQEAMEQQEMAMMVAPPEAAPPGAAGPPVDEGAPPTANAEAV